MKPDRLLILGCSQMKCSAKGYLPAIERYDGPLYRVLRAYRDGGGKLPPIWIVSAKLGLIEAGLPIREYEQVLTQERAAELKLHLDARRDLLASLPKDGDVLIVAGKLYVEVVHHWLRDVEPTRYHVAEGGIGTKLGGLKRWLEAA